MLLEVLARVAGVVGQILKDPIGFLGNLIQAVKQGFLNFMKNIGKHLQAGLIGWLTGTMAEAGIQLPEKFDLKGIFSLAMQILGFTYEVIRAQAVKRLGENKVSRLEQTVEVFKVLASQGIAGMWQFVQDRLGDLNTLVVEPIKNFVVEKVITAGIEWILSLLTPASAFIKAAKAIYEIVKFFIERAGQIADLINAILDAIGAIAAGSIDQAVKGVENALAKSLPVVISFLASLLGLGGIAGKIQAIFQKLRKPMEKAVDWVIDKGAKAFKKIGNKFNKSNKHKRNKVDERSGGQKQTTVNDKNNQQNQGQSDKRTEQQKKADLHKAITKAGQIMKQQGATPESIKAKLPVLQSKYRLTSLELVKTSDNKYHVEGKVNPQEKTPDITISQADENWEKAWRAKQEEVHNAMQQFVPRFQALDRDAQVNIRGSLASGVKMNPKKKASNGEPYVFNPTDFDIDAYVVSDNLFRQALNNNPTAARDGQIVGSKSGIKEVNKLIRDMREVLANISGNRDTGNVKWQFNVLIRSSGNADFTTKKDRRAVKTLGLEPSRGNPLTIQPPDQNNT